MRVTMWTPFLRAGDGGPGGRIGLWPVTLWPLPPHAQQALLPPSPRGGWVSTSRPSGRVQGPASHSFMQAEKYKPICADLKPTEGHLVGKRVGI